MCLISSYIKGSKKVRPKSICINIYLYLSYVSKDFQKWDLPEYRYLLIDRSIHIDDNRSTYLGKCLKVYFKAVGIHIFKDTSTGLFVKVL